MYQQFTYEERTRVDALRAAHSTVQTHSDFRRHRRPLRRTWWWVREHVRRDHVIDLRDLPTVRVRVADRPVSPEFLDVTDPVAVGDLWALRGAARLE